MSWLKSGIDLSFTNGFYESRSLQQSSQRCVGYYPVTHDAPTLSPESLYAQSGIDAVDTSLDGVCRGSHTMNGVPYSVSGQKLYSITQTLNADGTASWSSSELGDIPGSGRVIMSSGKTGDSFELVIVDPGVATYHYDLSTDTLSTLDGEANFLSPAIDVANVFGFFVFLQEGTNKIFHSNLRDAQTYNALDFFTVTQAESLKGIINFRDQLFVFSDYKLIPFNYTASATGFAFQSQFNAVKPYGLRNVYGKADLGSYLCFLGNRRNAEPAIFVYTGGEPSKISTEAIDKKLQNLTTKQLDEAFILTWSQGGGDFFSITAGDECYVFNFRSMRWSENRSWISGDSKRWRVNSITQAYNVLLVGDFQSGYVGILDDDKQTEYGEEMHRYIILQPYDAKGRFIQLKSIILVGDQPGSFTLEVSRDGVLWTGNQVERTTAVGEYGKMYKWDQLGTIPFLGSIRIGTSSTTPCNINKLVALI